MKKSDRLDSICISRLLKYIQTLRDAYDMFNITNADDLAANDICQLAVTQIITNIYELKLKMQSKSLDKTPLFNKIGLRASRNIASHDYDSLDFEIIYKQTCQLLCQEVSDELEAAKDAIKRNSTGDP